MIPSTKQAELPSAQIQDPYSSLDLLKYQKTLIFLSTAVPSTAFQAFIQSHLTALARPP